MLEFNERFMSQLKCESNVQTQCTHQENHLCLAKFFFTENWWFLFSFLVGFVGENRKIYELNSV